MKVVRCSMRLLQVETRRCGLWLGCCRSWAPGLDVNVVLTSDERSALYLATSLGHEDAARRLVRAGADVNCFNVRRNFRDPQGKIVNECEGLATC